MNYAWLRWCRRLGIKVMLTNLWSSPSTSILPYGKISGYSGLWYQTLKDVVEEFGSWENRKNYKSWSFEELWLMLKSKRKIHLKKLVGRKSAMNVSKNDFFVRCFLCDQDFVVLYRSLHLLACLTSTTSRGIYIGLFDHSPLPSSCIFSPSGHRCDGKAFITEKNAIFRHFPPPPPQWS